MNLIPFAGVSIEVILKNETSESSLVPFGSVRFALLIVLFLTATYRKQFSILTELAPNPKLPESVTRWLDQSSESLGEENDADRSTNFIVGNVSNRIEDTA